MTVVDLGGMTVTAKASVRTSHIDYDLATIKDDLGIPANDVSSDAWLERRISGIWARFEKYTARYLCSPPAQFVDDWSRLASGPHAPNQPPVLEHAPVGSPFLRVSPVVSIDAITRDSQVGDPLAVRFEPTTGKLFSLNEAWPGGHDVSHELACGLVKITYTAGWEEIPPDLYEALIGILGVMWNQRSGQTAGLPGGGGVSSINVVDVGTVEVGTEGNSFVASSMKGGRTEDPMLGPWAYVLQEYCDYRVQIGSPLIPVTEMVVTP